MKKTIIISLCILFSISHVIAQQIEGVVYYLNTGRTVASDIPITITGCQTVISNEYGQFIIDCNKKSGERLNLVIGAKNGDGDEIRHVNHKSFDNFFVPRNPTKPIEIYIALKEDFEKQAAKYYGFFIDKSAELSKIKSELLEAQKIIINQSSSEEKEKYYVIEIDKLEDEKKLLEIKYQTVAEELASFNRDNPSEILKLAFTKINEGKIDEALNALDTKKIEEQYIKSNLKAKDDAQATIEAYRLRIKLLKSQHVYKEIYTLYNKILEISQKTWNDNDWDKANLAEKYVEFGIDMFEIQKIEEAKTYTQKGVEIVEELYTRTGNKVYSEIEYFAFKIESNKTLIKCFLYTKDYEKALNVLKEKDSIVSKLHSLFNFENSAYFLLDELFNLSAYSQLGKTEKAQNMLIGDYESILEDELLYYNKYGHYKSIASDKRSFIYFLKILLSSPNNSASKLEFYSNKFFEELKKDIEESDLRGKEYLYQQASIIKYVSNDFENAIKYGARAFELYNELELNYGLEHATFMIMMAKCFEQTGEIDMSIHFRLKAIEIKEKNTNSKKVLSDAYYSYGKDLIFWGKHTESQIILLKFLKIYGDLESIEPIKLVRAYLYIGVTFAKQKNNQQAIAYYNKALQNYKSNKTSEPKLLSEIYHYIAWSNSNLNNNKEALIFFLKTLQIEEKIYTNSIHLTDLHIDIAKSYYKISKKSKKVNKHIQIAKGLLEQGNDWESIKKERLTGKISTFTDIITVKN